MIKNAPVKDVIASVQTKLAFFSAFFKFIHYFSYNINLPHVLCGIYCDLYYSPPFNA